MSDDAIAARPLPVSAQAPGKCILFGEHAVVHGAPELLLAVDLTTQVVVSAGPAVRLNGDAEALARNPYLRAALAAAWPSAAPVDIRSISRVPRAAGLGSSGAFVSALAAALGAATGGVDRSALAQRCFAIERGAQGVGSPGDTSASVAGGYVTLNAPGSGEPLWTVTADAERWEIRRAPDPGWVWVVAYSGVSRSTAEAVRAVGQRLARPDREELLGRFARVARAGIDAVARGDREATGRWLLENQELLREVDVSHPRVESLLAAAAPASLGAKVTGAGRGGALVALPTPGKEAELVRRLARAGAVPFAVRPAAGVALIEGAPSLDRST